MATTRGAIRAAAANVCGLLAKTGTATGGTASTLVHATGNDALLSSLDSADLYEGLFLLLTSGVEAGNWREIASYAPLTGTLTTAEAFGTGPSNGDTYEVYAGLTPNDWSLGGLTSIVDVGLTRCLYRTRSPITLVTDGDMETAGVTNWTASSSTLAKSTSEAISSGTQALVVTNTGANGYAQSASIGVLPSGSYQVWVCYRGRTTATTSTGTLIVWDVTNAAQITSGTGPDNGVNYRGGAINIGFAVPSTCRQIAFRLQGTEAGAVIAWDDLIMMDPQANQYPAPSWVSTRDQLWACEVRSGNRPFSFTYGDAGWPLDIEDDPTAVTTFGLNLPRNLNMPVYVRGTRPFGPMSAVADATAINVNFELAKYACASAAYDNYALDIEQSSQGRVHSDWSQVEMRLQPLLARYTPRIPARLGWREGWTGDNYSRLAG